MKKQLVTIWGMLLFGFIFPTTFLIETTGFSHLVNLIKSVGKM